MKIYVVVDWEGLDTLWSTRELAEKRIEEIIAEGYHNGGECVIEREVDDK